jgi:hypothetical protein
MTLHTGDGCSISRESNMLGHVLTDNCDVNASGQSENTGCQIEANDPLTYGSGFNNNGGGVYATEITSSFINIFFFPRGSLPSDISGASPDPSSWGTPMAVYKGDCDIASTFNKLQIVFTNTFWIMRLQGGHVRTLRQEQPERFRRCLLVRELTQGLQARNCVFQPQGDELIQH